MDIFGKKFVWGKVLEIHEAGEYTIIEFLDKYSNIKSFYGYANEKASDNAWGSFDEALIGLIALKYDGLNTRACGYFCRGIGLYEQQEINHKKLSKIE